MKKSAINFGNGLKAAPAQQSPKSREPDVYPSDDDAAIRKADQENSLASRKRNNMIFNAVALAVVIYAIGAELARYL